MPEAQSVASMAWAEPLFPLVTNPELDARALSVFPEVPNELATISRLPWLWEFQFQALRKPRAEVPFDLLAIAQLVASQENACRYCFGAQRAVMRLMGYTPEQIDRLEAELAVADRSPRDSAVVAFTRALSRSSPRPAASEIARLEAHGLSQLAGRELAYFIAHTCFSNRMNTCLSTAPETNLEKLSTTWLGRVMARFASRKLRPVKQPLSPRRDFAGPFAKVTSTLAGLPVAELLDRALTDAFASPVLPRRAKLLMFAVVARGLGCPVCSAGALEQLTASGFSPEAAEGVLTHLAGKELDDVESILVPWTRETVRYASGDLQKSTRALHEKLGPERTLEAIGVASLANLVVRVAMFAQ
jgi:alkylhydroperoxidase family enzyme